MYAPEGYISLSEIKREIAVIAEAWRNATPHDDDVGDASDWLDFNFDNGWSREVAYREWLMNQFLWLEERRLFCCLPNGKALKLADTVTQRLKVYDGPFDDTPSGWLAITKHLEEPFVLIDPFDFIVDISRLDAFGDPQGMPDEMGKAALKALQVIDGCPVCWKLPNGEMPEDWLAICGQTDISSEIRRAGRPEKVGRVAAAYTAIYPHGHGGLTRKSVARRVQGEVGFSFGLDTLDRAIKLANLS